MILLDASVLLVAEDLDDPEHLPSLALLRSGDLATLDLALYETTNVAITHWNDPNAAARLAQRVWVIAEFGTLVRVDRDLGADVARLATEHALSAYDQFLGRKPLS
ncbi:MAG: PIN domain-containing protein [Solirubrobacteraceae bacterium]